MTQKPLKTITLRDLKDKLDWLLAKPDSTLVYLGAGDLTIVRAKTRQHATSTTPEIVNIELFEDYEVTYDPDESD